MEEDTIVSDPVVLSPFMEEVHATYKAVQELERIFFQPDSQINFNQFHTQCKHLTSFLSAYYGQPTFKSAIEPLSGSPFLFIPSGLLSYHTSPGLISELPQRPIHQDQKFTNDKMPPIISEPTIHVPKITYPVVSSIPFSIIDEKDQLQSLVQKIISPTSNIHEIGLSFIEHPYPAQLSIISLCIREFEYLIDIVEIPDALFELIPIFESPTIVKIFHNAAKSAYLLHSYGIPIVQNSFDISTAVQFLSLSSSLQDLTAKFRHTLREGWIEDTPQRISQMPVIPTERSSDDFAKTLSEIAKTSNPDWRLRPLSLTQMRYARQEVHYLIYLYDSLRNKLISNQSQVIPNALSYVHKISHHKMSLNWQDYLFVIRNPNPHILASLYQQPLPNMSILKQLYALRHNQFKSQNNPSQNPPQKLPSNNTINNANNNNNNNNINNNNNNINNNINNNNNVDNNTEKTQVEQESNQLYPRVLSQSSLQHQNVPKSHELILSNASILWLSLTLPTTESGLSQALKESKPQLSTVFSPKPIKPLEPNFKQYLLETIAKAVNILKIQDTKEAPKHEKTLEEALVDLGWIPNTTKPASTPDEPSDFYLETTLSPREETSSEPSSAYLKHLRDPDQPTSVSKQIEGIPTTESQIFNLANNVRIMQKIYGKTKAKFSAGKEEILSEETPDDVLNNLVSIGYIDNNERKKLRAKFTVPKAPRSNQRRSSEPSRSEPSKPEYSRSDYSKRGSEYIKPGSRKPNFK